MWPGVRVAEERKWTTGSIERQIFLMADFIFFDRVSF